MGTLDRYVIRQVIPPFLLALVIFTFILEIPPIMENAERLIAKGVPWPTVGRILLTLLPSGLGIAIPVALLVGLLVGLGRLSGDRETVAMLACGVSLYRLLRPVVVLSVAGVRGDPLGPDLRDPRRQPDLPRDHLRHHRRQGGA